MDKHIHKFSEIALSTSVESQVGSNRPIQDDLEEQPSEQGSLLQAR